MKKLLVSAATLIIFLAGAVTANAEEYVYITDIGYEQMKIPETSLSNYAGKEIDTPTVCLTLYAYSDTPVDKVGIYVEFVFCPEAPYLKSSFEEEDFATDSEGKKPVVEFLTPNLPIEEQLKIAKTTLKAKESQLRVSGNCVIYRTETQYIVPFTNNELTFKWNGLTKNNRSLSREKVQIYAVSEFEPESFLSNAVMLFFKMFAPTDVIVNEAENYFLTLNLYEVTDAAVYYIREDDFDQPARNMNYDCINSGGMFTEAKQLYNFFDDKIPEEYHNAPYMVKVAVLDCGENLAASVGLEGNKPYDPNKDVLEKRSLGLDQNIPPGQYARFIMWRSPYEKAGTIESADLYGLVTKYISTGSGMGYTTGDTKFFYNRKGQEIVIAGYQDGLCRIIDHSGRVLQTTKINSDEQHIAVDKVTDVTPFIIDVEKDGVHKAIKAIK